VASKVDEATLKKVADKALQKAADDKKALANAAEKTIAEKELQKAAAEKTALANAAEKTVGGS
jgi:hypothetical protein